jgi:hypothetical protein
MSSVLTLHFKVLFSWFLASEAKDTCSQYISLEDRSSCCFVVYVLVFGRIVIIFNIQIWSCLFITNQSNSLPYIDYSIGRYQNFYILWKGFLSKPVVILRFFNVCHEFYSSLKLCLVNSTLISPCLIKRRSQNKGNYNCQKFFLTRILSRWLEIWSNFKEKVGC